MRDGPSLAQIAGWRGHEVVSVDGAKVGRVDEIVYDFETQRPVWLGVGSGPFGVRTLLVPVESAAPDGAVLRIECSQKMIEDEPEVDIGEGFDSTQEAAALFGYFGVPFEPNRDLRVLHRDADLPGLESSF